MGVSAAHTRFDYRWSTGHVVTESQVEEYVCRSQSVKTAYVGIRCIFQSMSTFAGSLSECQQCLKFQRMSTYAEISHEKLHRLTKIIFEK